MISVMIFCKNNVITSYEEASSIVIYDMDSRKVVLTMEKPSLPDMLEDIVEEYDVCALLTTSISPENRSAFEEMGVKTVIVEQVSIDEVIEEIFT